MPSCTFAAARRTGAKNRIMEMMQTRLRNVVGNGISVGLGKPRAQYIFKASLGWVGFLSLALMSSTAWGAAARTVSFSQPAQTVEAYDFVEVIANVDKPDAKNPFLEASFTGSFSKADGGDRKNIEGFCDSADGSVFRIRFIDRKSVV